MWHQPVMEQGHYSLCPPPCHCTWSRKVRLQKEAVLKKYPAAPASLSFLTGARYVGSGDHGGHIETVERYPCQRSQAPWAQSAAGPPSQPMTDKVAPELAPQERSSRLPAWTVGGWQEWASLVD